MCSGIFCLTSTLWYNKVMCKKKRLFGYLFLINEGKFNSILRRETHFLTKYLSCSRPSLYAVTNIHFPSMNSTWTTYVSWMYNQNFDPQTWDWKHLLKRLGISVTSGEHFVAIPHNCRGSKTLSYSFLSYLHFLLLFLLNEIVELEI